MAADSGRPQRGVCFRAHGKRAGRRIQVIAWISVLLTGLRHGAHFHNHLRAIPAWRRSHLSGLRHGDHAHRYSRGISSWRRGLLASLRHGHHAHRCLSAIPAWRSDTKPMPNRSMNGVNGWLRHGHPAYRHLSGIPAWRNIIQPVPDRSLSDALAGPSARRPSSKASQGLVLCNEYRSGDFRVREG